MMGRFKRAIGLEKAAYHATQLGENIETTGADLNGVLMEVTPHPDNLGPDSMKAVYEKMHGAATKPVNAFEIHFVEGEVSFRFYAEGEPEAEEIRRGINNSYANSKTRKVTSTDQAFPAIGPEDYVSGAYVTKYHPTYQVPYLPIGSYQSKGWKPEQHPISDVISSMNSGADTRVVVQVIGHALGDTWHGGLPIIDLSSEKVKSHMDQNGDGDLKKYVDEMTKQLVFASNLRIVAISPDPSKASNRVAGIAHDFDSKFKSDCGMRLSTNPVDSRLASRQRSLMDTFIERMRIRKYNVRHKIRLGAVELTALHIPAEGSGAPGIKWKRGRTGSEAPVDKPEHHVPGDEMPLGGERR